MTLGYDISDVSHTVYESTSSMSKRSPTPYNFPQNKVLTFI